MTGKSTSSHWNGVRQAAQTLRDMDLGPAENIALDELLQQVDDVEEVNDQKAE
jgi:hypothetical protein